MQPRFLPAAMAAAAFSFVLPAQVASAPCFESNFGTLLGSGDDLVFPTASLGFTFPYASGNYTQIEVSSNGFVWLGGNGNFNSRCCSGTGTQFVADPPSIAILWTDLVTSGGNSGVWFNALPGRAVITWRDTVEFGSSVQFTLQMQLTALGEVTFWYSPTTAITSAFHSAVAGITPGNGAVDPGSIDLSASFPYASATLPTIYEQWPGGAFDLATRTWELIPNGQGSFLALDRTGCPFTPGSFTPYGAGCPALSAIEMIPVGNGYVVNATTNAAWFGGTTNATNLGDDQTLAVSLPFTFPYPGGSTAAVGLCSNGFVHLGASTASPYTPNVADFLAGPPRIFGCWTDWYRPGAGQIYSDQISATAWAFSWIDVAEFANSTPGGRWQMQLEASGRVVLLYAAMNITGHDVLVGFSRGNGVLDPGNTDLSVAMPFTTGNPNPEFYELFSPGSLFDLVSPTVPLVLSQDAGNPVIGTTYALRVGSQAPSSIATFLVLGFTQIPAGLPLDGLGMTNCRQYLTLDASTFVPTTFPDTICTLNLPNNGSLVGFTLYGQAANFAPGVNPLGVEASNGGAITLGTF